MSMKIIHRSSKLFQPIVTLQKNEQIKNVNALSRSQKLLLDLGIIKQSNPGSFHLLPLGVRSFEKLTKLIDDEMKSLNAQKLIMPTLINSRLWDTSGRMQETDSELFKLKDRHGVNYIISPTHEEVAADLLASLGPITHKQFPMRVYQITSKFRDEMKPRFGLMRARQFFMKDLYSFDIDVQSAEKTYQMVCESYDRFFRKIGLDFVKVLGTQGNMGGPFSHEYHFLSNIGEDRILTCSNCNYSANVELSGDKRCPKCESEDGINITNGIEVGHTFFLGDKYSKPFKAHYLNENSKPVVLQMGSYGLGLSRILAAAVEVLSLEHEIRWPTVLAPYKIVIIPPKRGSKEERSLLQHPEELYSLLNEVPEVSDDVLLDDRSEMTIGRRLLDANRTGYPFIVVIGSKAAQESPLYEVIAIDKEPQFLSREQLLDVLGEHGNNHRKLKQSAS